MSAKNPPSSLHVVQADSVETETRFLIPETDTYLDAINTARATPTGKAKAKSPLNTPSDWKEFFESSKFIDKDKGDFLPQSTIKAMKEGLGVKEEKKALTFLAALNNAIRKYKLTVNQPTCVQIQGQYSNNKDVKSK